MNHSYVPHNGSLFANLMSINFSNMNASVKQYLLRFKVLTMLKILESSGMFMPCSQVENYAAFAVGCGIMLEFFSLPRLVYFIWYWCVLHLKLKVGL